MVYLSSEKKPDIDDKRQVYSLYYQFTSALKYLKPHQILAINRGEKEKILKVTVSIPERDWLTAIISQYPPNDKSIFNQELKKAIDDCAKRLLLPTIERDIRRVLTDRAEAHAIDVFASNLIRPPDSTTIGEPGCFSDRSGFRTGSKVAVVDPTGKLLDTATVYPHPPQNNTSTSLSGYRKAD
jgi:protein Tex